MKQTGCIEVNNKRIDIKALCDLILDGTKVFGDTGRKYTALELATNDFKNCYRFQFGSGRFYLDYERQNRDKGIYHLERSIGDYADINSLIKGFVADAIKNEVQLDIFNNIVMTKETKPSDNPNIREEASRFLELFGARSWDIDHEPARSVLAITQSMAMGGDLAHMENPGTDKHALLYGLIKALEKANMPLLAASYKKPCEFTKEEEKRINIYYSWICNKLGVSANQVSHLGSADKSINGNVNIKPIKRSEAELHRNNKQFPQYNAVGRIIDCNKKLLGLTLLDGSQRRRYTLEDCIAFAKDGKIKNVKAVTRGTNTYLQGNGISLESLQQVII
jgi:hypothetical protein